MGDDTRTGAVVVDGGGWKMSPNLTYLSKVEVEVTGQREARVYRKDDLSQDAARGPVAWALRKS